jgi:hypothetical protein
MMPLDSSLMSLVENDLEIGYVISPCHSHLDVSWLHQIGEISLMKEMTSVASTMMSEEDKAELEKEMNGRSSPATGGASTPSVTHPEATAQTHTTSPLKPTAPTASSPSPSSNEQHTNGMSDSVIASPGPGGNEEASVSSKPTKEKDGKKRQKMTLEQRAKLQELEKERRKAMEERITYLTKKLIEVLRPLVEAKHPGDKDDPETAAFESRIRKEAEDLKFESFGVEVRFHHVISTATG